MWNPQPELKTTIPVPPFPAEGAGNQTFSNFRLLSAIFGVPLLLSILANTPWAVYLVLVPIFALPIFAGYFVLSSMFARPKDSRVLLPGKNIEEYMTFKDEKLKAVYFGRNKIPMETFFEAYFDGKVDLNGDCLDIFELRHDWAKFCFTLGQAKFFLLHWIPETIWHSKKQDEDQVRDHYDRGDDFYAAFLGRPMVYTSGIVSDPSKNETLDEIQANKIKLVCDKLQLKTGERHLDIGCGWGTLVATAARDYGTYSTGITLGHNQTKFGKDRCAEYGVPDRARILCMDYRDIPRCPKFNKISCLEMAEHVGIRKFGEFLDQIRDMLDDDGLFFLQIAGLRATWQYEDFIWGLFMAKYVFPGADASLPLYWVIKQLECSGFEIKNVDTIGVHYSATLYRWYKNWMHNKEKVIAVYGERWFRTWEVFLSWSTIISRQGSASCYQIVAHKNRNAFDRAALITTGTGRLGQFRA